MNLGIASGRRAMKKHPSPHGERGDEPSASTRFRRSSASHPRFASLLYYCAVKNVTNPSHYLAMSRLNRSQSRSSDSTVELIQSPVGWVERSEPHHDREKLLVGLASLDPPYESLTVRSKTN